MDREVRHGLATLQAIAPELNVAADAVTAVIRRVERILGEMDLGVSAQTDVFERRAEDSPGDSCFMEYHLAYGRLAGRFRVYINEAVIDRDAFGDDELIRINQLDWSSAPRDLRLRAFQELPALLQSIACRAKELVQGVGETGSQAEAVLAGLEANLGVARQDR